MDALFDFTPDDGPTETIVVPSVNPSLFAELERAAVEDSNDTLKVNAYEQESGPSTCRALLFRAARISNVRKA
jgi:hypothetical protein